MKYLDEYRDSGAVASLAREIERTATRPWALMEICGGQTHSILKYGLDELLPHLVSLIHGPGCPVCVTPVELIDKAQHLAQQPGFILCSFGDMLRVPGSRTDFLSLKALGADIRVVYSPLEAVRLAEAHPQKQVVFFAVGFETTAPATAMAVFQAERQKLTNFSLLVSHVLVPPALEAILSDPGCQIDGVLAAGHVCAVMGEAEYIPLAKRRRVPVVVTGFEPVDILQGVLMCLRQLESGRAEVENQYSRAVRTEGNPLARQAVVRAFRVVDRKWRGIGTIPASGFGLRPEFAAFDAEAKFDLANVQADEPAECRSGEVLRGMIKPHECAAFGNRCNPEHPLGAPMVSSEGACAAYYRYGKATLK